jgi:GntR family transcriptional regulator
VVEREYRRVADALRDQILSGELGEGDRLPSIRQLVMRHGVTAGTAARAVAALRAEGLVITAHGSGAFVRRFAPIRRSSPGRLARDQWGAGKQIQDSDTGQRPRTVDVEVGEVPAPDWVAEALGVAPGTPVVYRSRRFIVEDRPVQLATSYLDLELVRGTSITYTDVGPGGIYARLADIGQEPVKFTEELRARMPTPDEVAKLTLPDGTPVIEIKRCAFTEPGRCVEVNRMALDASAYLLDYAFTA